MFISWETNWECDEQNKSQINIIIFPYINNNEHQSNNLLHLFIIFYSLASMSMKVFTKFMGSKVECLSCPKTFNYTTYCFAMSYVYIPIKLHAMRWKHGKICQKNSHTCSQSHIYGINMTKSIQNFLTFIMKQWCTSLSLW
jgi:hypothetical protein